jgi:hypothetical protein
MVQSQDIIEWVVKGLTAGGMIATAIKSWRVGAQVQQVHLAVNSRLDALLDAKDEIMREAVAAATATAHQAGVEQGQAQATHTDKQTTADYYQQRHDEGSAGRKNE